MMPLISAMQLRKHYLIYLVVLLASVFIAAMFPITNDESYYIAFSRHLHLSYVDAPPFVSYLTMLQTHLGFMSALGLRSLVIILHLLSTLFLLAIVYNHCSRDSDINTKLLLTFLIAYLVPIFGLFGIFILPDTGLILALSMMLWAADDAVCKGSLSWKYTIVTGIGLGAGLLSKYHILPLGGGIFLGTVLDLYSSKSFRFNRSNLGKLISCIVIALVCGLPLFIWNIEHHYASFVFQLQHGFSSDRWRITSMLAFLLGSLLYMTPVFSFVLFKQGLHGKLRWYLLIPVYSLLFITLMSSLRKPVLPHWISPAFWLLIPYAVIYSGKYFKTLIASCKVTSIIWLVLIGLLLLPGGMTNIKKVTRLVTPDAGSLADLLLWEELPVLLQQNTTLARAIEHTVHEPPAPGCLETKPLVGTLRWFWTSQFEYRHLVKGAKILNLDPGSSSYYLWRDEWPAYANCNVLMIGKEDNLERLSRIMTINSTEFVHGLGDYRSLNLMVVSGTLKDRDTLKQVQDDMREHPHY